MNRLRRTVLGAFVALLAKPLAGLAAWNESAWPCSTSASVGPADADASVEGRPKAGELSTASVTCTTWFFFLFLFWGR